MTRGRPARTGHGDYGYAQRHRCPCEPCRLAVNRYSKRLAFDKAQGRRRTVDAAPVREYVMALVDAGATIPQISLATGNKVKKQQIARLLYGDLRYDGRAVEVLYPSTAAELMALQVTHVLAQSTFVPGIGTHRRVQALAARGFTKDDIGREVGVSGSAVFNWMSRPTVTSKVADKMKAAYDRMCMGEGTSETMRWRAIREGWAPPLAWTEETIDDPEAEPDRSVLKCAVSRCSKPVAKKWCVCAAHHDTLRRSDAYRNPRKFREAVLRLGQKSQYDNAAFLEELADLRGLGVTDPEVAARRLGRGVKYVQKHWNKVA